MRNTSQVKRVGVDQGVDLPALRRLSEQGKITLHQAHDLEQEFRRVKQEGRAAKYGQAKYEVDKYADEKIFAEVLKIVGSENIMDAEHVYAAHLNRCDYFLTEDRSHLITGGRRKKLEGLLGLKIRTSAEFLAEISGGDA